MRTAIDEPYGIRCVSKLIEEAVRVCVGESFCGYQFISPALPALLTPVQLHILHGRVDKNGHTNADQDIQHGVIHGLVLT